MSSIQPAFASKSLPRFDSPILLGLIPALRAFMVTMVAMVAMAAASPILAGLPTADLSVVSVNASSNVTAGTNLTYAITVTNTGPSAAPLSSLTDTVPAGTSFVSLTAAAGWTCTTPAVGAGGTISCSNPSYAVNSPSAFTLVVQVPAATPSGTQLSNTAAISTAGTTDSNPANDSKTATTTVLITAPLSLTNVDTPDPVYAGNNLTYAITVSNAGPSNAQSVVLSDTLPVETTFVALTAPGGWSCTTPAVGATGAISCTNPSLAAGIVAFSLVVNVIGTTPVGTVLSDTATASSNSGAGVAATALSTKAVPKFGNPGATATTTVVGSADLSVSKVASPNPATAGANLTYTITLTNAGPSLAAEASLSDTVPAGTTFVSLTAPGGWSCNTPAVGAVGSISCNMNTLAVGDAVFTLIVSVPASTPVGSGIVNTASASSATADPNSDNNSGTAGVTVASVAALSVTNIDTPDPVMAGANLTYTITVTNGGPSYANSATLADTLPAGTTFVSLTAAAGWTCSTPAVGAAGSISCTILTFPLSSAVFTLVVNVAGSTPGGTVLSDTASATTPQVIPNVRRTPRVASGGDPSMATATTTVVASADLTMAMVASSNPIIAGNDLTYTLTLTNSGPSLAMTATLADAVPAGTTFVSLASPGGWTCTTPAVGATGSVSCSIPSLAVTSAVFTLVVHVPASAVNGSGIVNTANASSATADPNVENNGASTGTTVAAVTAMSITNIDTPDPVTAGANLSYAIVVTNAGPSTATTPLLVDALPAGTTFVSLAFADGWSCTTPAVGAAGSISCGIPTFPAGSAPFMLVVKVAAATPAGTVLSDTASVSSVIVVPNLNRTARVRLVPDPGSASATATTTVTGTADLSVVNLGAPNPVVAGGNLTFTITLTNAGPSGAASATLSDTLPAGTSFVSLASPDGWSCTTPVAGAGGTVSCTNSLMPAGSVVFTLVVKVAASTTAGALVSNTATATSATMDPNAGNESSTATVTVNSPANVTATKTVTGTFAPGGAVVYAIVLTNTSAAAQGDNPGDEFVDVLPLGLVLVSASATSGTTFANLPANTVTWNGAIPGNTTVTITIQASLASAVLPGQIMSNQGTVNYDAAGNGVNSGHSVTGSVAVPGSQSATIFVVAAATPAVIPALDGFRILALAVILALAGLFFVRRRTRP